MCWTLKKGKVPTFIADSHLAAILTGLNCLQIGSLVAICYLLSYINYLHIFEQERCGTPLDSWADVELSSPGKEYCMSTNVKKRSDLVLALLFANDTTSINTPNPIGGITRLEKLLFLLKKEAGFLKEVSASDDFHFVPFKMGPWTGEVYDEIDFLESLGLVSRRLTQEQSPEDAAHEDELFSDLILDKYQKGDLQTDGEGEVFSLTDKGKKKALEIWERLSTEERQKIVAIKRQFNTMNLRQFLRYVYKKYPEFTTESEIKGELGL
jgi:hypothetical protein